MTTKLNKFSALVLNFQLKSSFLLAITFLSVLTSCAGKQTKTSGDDSNNQVPGGGRHLVRCESKAIVKDLQHNKIHKLSIDFLAAGNSQMRIEVSALLGVGLASILFKDNQTKYASYREKKYYQIQDFDRSLEEVFKVPLRPNYFFNILYGQEIHDDHWSCTKNSRNLVEHCQQEQENISIDWTYESTGKRQITIRSPKSEVNWTFNQLQTEVNPHPQAFVLDPPKGFTIIKM